MKLHVVVTQEDIDEATRRLTDERGISRASNCPIAIACEREFADDAYDAMVAGDVIFVPKTRATEKTWRSEWFPDYVQDFIRGFDRKQLVAPITFDIDVELSN